MILLTSQVKTYNPAFVNVTDRGDAVDASTQTTPAKMYWNEHHLVADWPELTLPGGYTHFMLYSTDHVVPDGGIFLGVFNDVLDLSDFIEVGKSGAINTPVVSGFSAETPCLVRHAGETRPISLYFHTVTTDPANVNGIQETRLYTTTGGDLINSTWVDEGNPLGFVPDDTHTGYCRVWNDGAITNALHYKGLIGGRQTWQHSSSTDNGRTFTRGAIANTEANCELGKRFVPPFGTFFQYLGAWWWLGNQKPIGTGGEWAHEGVLCKANANREILESVAVLENNWLGGVWDFYIEGDIAYGTMVRSSAAWRRYTLDLTQLSIFLP